MLMPSIYLVRPNFLNVKRSFLLNLSIQKRYSRSVTDVSHLLQPSPRNDDEDIDSMTRRRDNGIGYSFSSLGGRSVLLANFFARIP